MDLSFRDIERIVGGILPKAAARETWWKADDTPAAQPQQRVFARCGFVAKPCIRAEMVRFVRADLDVTDRLPTAVNDVLP